MSEKQELNRSEWLWVCACTCALLIIGLLLGGCTTSAPPPQQFTVVPEASVKLSATATQQDCQGDSVTWFIGNCNGDDTDDKVFGVHDWWWGGTRYAVVVHGNEIKVRNQAGTLITGTRCKPDLVGDEDYAAQSPALCDDCEYGFLGLSTALCAFRVVEYQGKPRIVDEIKLNTSQVPGGYTFEHGGNQYLIGQSADLGGCGADSGLYGIDAVDSYTLIECLPGRQIVAGVEIGEGYVALGDKSQVVYVYEIGGE